MQWNKEKREFVSCSVDCVCVTDVENTWLVTITQALPLIVSLFCPLEVHNRSHEGAALPWPVSGPTVLEPLCHCWWWVHLLNSFNSTSRGEQWMDTVQSKMGAFFNLKPCFRTSRQGEAIMVAMRLRSWCAMCYVVLCCLQIQAGGCCSSVCGDCTQSTQPVQWKERLTSGYGYGPDCIFIIVSF